MNKLNTIILLVIVLIGVYYISNESPIETLKTFFNKVKMFFVNAYSNFIKKQIPDMIDGYYSENFEDKIIDKLNQYLMTIVDEDINKEMKYTNKVEINGSDRQSIISYLEKKLNNYSYEFMNISLDNNKMYFFQNADYYEINPFNISCDYYHNDRYVGKLKMQIELKFIHNKETDIFVNKNDFNNMYGKFLLCRTNITNLSKTNRNLLNDDDISPPMHNDDETSVNFNYATEYEKLSDMEESTENVDFDYA